MNKIQKDAAIGCFKSNPNLQSVKVVEDGNCFTSDNALANHVRERKLDKNKTVTVTRDEVMQQPKQDVEGASAEGEVAKPVGKMNKAELLAKAAELELEVPEGATNKELVELIEAAQKGGSDNE